MASRWANDEADKAEELKRKKEKEEKKRLKLLKQQESQNLSTSQQDTDSRPSKRRRLSSSPANTPSQSSQEAPSNIQRFPFSSWSPCRHTSNFEILNPIEEGSYGYVSRARDLSSSAIVALKKVKMEHTATDGFPVTALREISILQRARHPNIVALHEVLAGNHLEECVLVMEFVEHDLKTLQDDMKDPFVASEVKTLLRQLVGAVGYLHDNFIAHRDLKTSNILLSNRGVLKLADFGMARVLPPPDAPLTELVVTLWYRAPELLLGTPNYGLEVDIWSVGCVFAELLLKRPVMTGGNEVDQLAHIFALCGLPTEKSWPAIWRLPYTRSLKLPRTQNMTPVFDRARFPPMTSASLDLLSSLLSLNPDHRPTASEVLDHPYFREQPKPKPPEMFPTFPSKAGQEKRRKRETPPAPKRGAAPGLGGTDFSGLFAHQGEEGGAGFALRMG